MRYRGLRCWFKVKRILLHYLNMVVFVCFIALCPHVVNSYGHIWTVSYPNHSVPIQACLGRLLVLRAHFFCQLKLTSALESVEANLPIMISFAHAGLEKSTRPLVFTSESSIRASGNLSRLARQDE